MRTKTNQQEPGRESNAVSERQSTLLVGVDSWSFHFAFGQSGVKLAQPMTARDLLAKVSGWGLKGAQVNAGDMPALESPEFGSFRRVLEERGLFWEVSAGLVQDEAGVRRALEYNAALGTKVVRAFMEGFGLQFRVVSLDDHVRDAMAHIRALLPEFEHRGLRLCLENHGGLRLRHLRRVLETFPSEHLGLNLDTGNPILTLEDPLTVIQELAPRTFTCHLKDWSLIPSAEGVIVRGCALGDGVVDLKAAVEILMARAPFPESLHLNIEAPQEYIPLPVLTPEFWQHQPEITAAELAHILRLARQRKLPANADYRIASMRGTPVQTILAEEEEAVARSIRYCRETLRII